MRMGVRGMMWMGGRADLNSPVQNCLKFSAVFGTTSANS